MVLTRAALEKLNKEELISLFFENVNKLNINMANLINQLAEVNKTLQRMESQLEILKTINNTLKKCITSLEKQCWRNEQNSRRDCVKIVASPDSTNETKVCELIEKIAGVDVNQDCLESCLCYPQTKKTITVKFSREKDPESVLQNKKKEEL